MNICFFYGNEKALSLAGWLKKEGHEVELISKQISSLKEYGSSFDLLVSFTYRFIVPQTVLDEVNGNAVNLHISYLPWNRGADPNIWSWIDNTPKGVSIHYMSDKIDAGDIIAQQLSIMNQEETLASSYNTLMSDVEQLFKTLFLLYPDWQKMRKKCIWEGTYHRSCQLLSYRENIDYDISVKDFLDEYEKSNGK